MSNTSLATPLASVPAIAPEQAPRHAPRTLALLQAPILPLRLSAPNTLVMLAQALTGLIETYWIVAISAPTPWPAWPSSSPDSCSCR